jgi:hypothetical protein
LAVALKAADTLKSWILNKNISRFHSDRYLWDVEILKPHYLSIFDLIPYFKKNE